MPQCMNHGRLALTYDDDTTTSVGVQIFRNSGNPSSRFGATCKCTASAIHAQLVSEATCEILDVTGPQGKPVIGRGSGHGRTRLNNIEAIHVEASFGKISSL